MRHLRYSNKYMAPLIGFAMNVISFFDYPASK